MPSTSSEDYIKAIYKLEAGGHKCTTKAIADEMGVRMASVTGMVKQLANEQYLEHTPYYGVKLTERGRRHALDIIRRHRLLELFLVETLGLGWDEVDADAEVLEHAVSDRLIERIYEFLGRPRFDPHGAPIPTKDGLLAPVAGRRLDKLPPDSSGFVVEVDDRDPEILRYLAGLGLGIGQSVKVLSKEPFDGPITLELGKSAVVLGVRVAAAIQIGDAPPSRDAEQ